MRNKYAIALQNEEQVLKHLARFSWLTSQQLGELIWHGSKNSNQMSNRTLQRLLDKRLVLSEPLSKKHFSEKYRAYYLSPFGKAYLEAFQPGTKIYGYFGCGRLNELGETYYLMSDKEHYHRFITNQFIIELELYDLLEMWSGDKVVFNENKIIANKKVFKSTLGCVPDAFFSINNEVGYVLETENVKRGPRKHGAKFYDFISNFWHQINVSDSEVYSPSVHEIKGVKGDHNFNLETKILFLCRDESIFRNIYRKVQNMINETFESQIADLKEMGGEFNISDNVYYLILNSEKPFQKKIIGNFDCLDHQYAAERVALGSRQFKYSDERMIEILEEKRDTGISMRELCEKHDINSANVYRWNKRFNILKIKENTPRGWGIDVQQE